MMNEKLSQIMTTDLITVNPDDNLSQVRDIFKNHRIHHLPVVEGKKLVGLITTSDLWKLNRVHEEYAEISVKDVMTVRLAYLQPEDKIGSAAELFLENLFHAVPVVDEDKNLKGIVTSFDVIKYGYNKEYPDHPWTS